jgi:hypothetical protein
MAGACGDNQSTSVAVIPNPEQGGAETVAAAADVIAADARFKESGAAMELNSVLQGIVVPLREAMG